MFDQLDAEILQLQRVFHAKWVFLYNNDSNRSILFLEISGGKDTEICESYRHHKCLEYATKVASNERQIDVNCDLGSFDYPSRCNCLPPCNEITYDYKTFNNDFAPYYEYAFMFPDLL
jgi:hypothetical protein